MLQRGKAGFPFILVTVFLDMLGFGIVIPVLPERGLEMSFRLDWLYGLHFVECCFVP
jgi:hypothetical protein